MRTALALFLLFISLNSYGQDSSKLVDFRQKVLPRYSAYFNNAQAREDGFLELSAADGYTKMSDKKKKSTMEDIALSWRERYIFVKNGDNNEMWGWDAVTGQIELLDTWGPQIPFDHGKNTQASFGKHPWFIYLGSQLGGDGQFNNLSFSINLRSGCYMFLNRLDIAAVLSYTSMYNSESNSETDILSYGISGRVYFPIKKIKLSPNTGGQLMVTSSSVSGALLLGLSWYIGVGSVDINLAIGSQVTASGGYTLIPSMLKK